ncbi:hypothetical protein QTN47_26150 [Danxiaibacter flavus]|uniref:Uncharacterized protein n=1 Tax=Danxiaibacter flavus TaxID=3049108 RepID=A0ABV3ZMH2_9BACT|nr:hypothetical protein QNM32_26150 [Chitinophagaceae bacterium DXS]
MQNPLPTTAASSKWLKLYNVLNKPETKEPCDIIVRFFNNYTLSEIREKLSDWFFDTLQEDNSDIKQHALLYNDLQKMVEAVYEVAHEVCDGKGMLPAE